MSNTTARRIKSIDAEMAATSIASEWLNFAESVIASGGRPAKLSETMATEINRQYETGYLVECKWNLAANERIAARALRIAAEFLNDGQFPTVRAFFIANAAK